MSNTVLPQEPPELIITSRTQSAETIKKLLEGQEYEGIETQTMTDRPEEDGAGKPTADTAVPAEKTSTSAPSTEAGGEKAAGERDGKTGTESETVQNPALPHGPPAEPAEKKKESGSARLKRQLQLKDAQISRLTVRLDDIERRLAGDKPAEKKAPETKTDESKAKPKLKDFLDAEPDRPYEESVDAYNDAYSDWKYQERERLAKEQAQPKTGESGGKDAPLDPAQKAEADRWTAQLDQAKAEHPDFDDKINGTAEKHGKVSAALAQAVRDSDDGGELVYWLSDHPEEFDRILEATRHEPGAPPREIRRKLAIAVREVERIEGLLGEEEEPAPPAVETKPPETTAQVPRAKPVPPTPVGRRGASSTRKLSDLPADELRERFRTDPSALEAFRKETQPGT